MNGANQNIPNTLPRLPSFQQLSETIRNPDFPDLLQKTHHQYHQQHRFQNTPIDCKSLMLFPINYTPVNDNGVATAAATATATAPVNGIVTTNSLNGNSIMEYSYGPTLHGRHESHPNQYVFPNQESKTGIPISNRVSPTSMDRTKAHSLDLELTNRVNTTNNDAKTYSKKYKVVFDLIQFLKKFEIKYNELKHYTFDLENDKNSNVLEKMVTELSIDDINEALVNTKKLANVFENIKSINKNSTKSTNDMRRKNGLFVYENGNKKQQQQQQQHGEKRKIRKKHQHQMAKTKSLSTNGEAIPMQMSVSRNNGSITSTGFLQLVQQQAPQPQPQSQPQTQHQQLQPALELVPPHTQAQTLSAVTSNLTNGNLNTELSAKPEITCQHCCSQETPEWRRGPEGSRTLCNACGLFYSKLIKKYGLREADKIMLHRKQTGTVNDRRIF